VKSLNQLFSGKYKNSPRTSEGSLKRAGRSCCGFTLVETMAVTAITAVLAAVIFPIAASAIRRTHVTYDVAEMKQLYSAVTLYEQDSDGVSPSSLLYTYPYIRTTATYKSLEDDVPRPPGIYDYPANLYTEHVSPLPHLRSPFRISYAYARTWFQTEYQPFTTWDSVRADSAAGMIADDMYAPIEYPQPPMLEGTKEQDWMRGSGPFYRINMDGSLAKGFKYGQSLGGEFGELFGDGPGQGFEPL